MPKRNKHVSDEEEEFDEEDIDDEEEVNEEEDEEQDNVAEKINPSPLNTCIIEAETLFESLRKYLERVEKMRLNYDRIVQTGLMDTDEIEEYRKSYTFHANTLKESLQAVVIKINNAKSIWEQKNTLISTLWREGTLDEGVVKKWKDSMTVYENRIAKIDEKLQLWSSSKK